jgi:hypothetical protein
MMAKHKPPKNQQGDANIATNCQLTNAEEKLLDVLLDPKNRLLNTTERCNLAGISRQTYYRIMRRPEFIAVYRQQSYDLFAQNIGPVVTAFIKQACQGSFPHGNEILEIMGMRRQSAPERANVDQFTAALTGKAPNPWDGDGDEA